MPATNSDNAHEKSVHTHIFEVLERGMNMYQQH